MSLKIADIDKLFIDISKEFETVDILINNAAINPEKSSITIETLDINTFKEVIDINVHGTSWMGKRYIPLLRNSDSGRIINFRWN